MDTGKNLVLVLAHTAVRQTQRQVQNSNTESQQLSCNLQPIPTSVLPSCFEGNLLTESLCTNGNTNVSTNGKTDLNWSEIAA